MYIDVIDLMYRVIRMVLFRYLFYTRGVTKLATYNQLIFLLLSPCNRFLQLKIGQEIYINIICVKVHLLIHPINHKLVLFQQ